MVHILNALYASSGAQSCNFKLKSAYFTSRNNTYQRTYQYIQIRTVTYLYMYIHTNTPAIHTNTFTYIPIHTRAQTYTAPYLRSARQLSFLYALSAVGNTAPESGRPKEARLRAATRNVASH